MCCQEHYSLMLLFGNFLLLVLGQQNLEPVLSMNCIGVFIPSSTCSLFAEKLTHEENLIIVLATNKKRKIKINNRVGRGSGGRGCSDIPYLTTLGLLLNFWGRRSSGFFDFSTLIIFLRDFLPIFQPMKRLFYLQYITLFTSLLSHIQFCVKEESGTINRNSAPSIIRKTYRLSLICNVHLFFVPANTPYLLTTDSVVPEIPFKNLTLVCTQRLTTHPSRIFG